MKPKKIFSWVLLILGILLIFWTLYSTYNIFTGKTSAPEIFKIEETKQAVLDESQESKTSPVSQEEAQERAQEEMKKLVGDQIKEMIPSTFMSKILNLISWSILAGILIFGGSRISGIGIKLIREG